MFEFFVGVSVGIAAMFALEFFGLFIVFRARRRRFESAIEDVRHELQDARLAKQESDNTVAMQNYYAGIKKALDSGSDS